MNIFLTLLFLVSWSSRAVCNARNLLFLHANCRTSRRLIGMWALPIFQSTSLRLMLELLGGCHWDRSLFFLGWWNNGGFLEANGGRRTDSTISSHPGSPSRPPTFRGFILVKADLISATGMCGTEPVNMWENEETWLGGALFVCSFVFLNT